MRSEYAHRTVLDAIEIVRWGRGTRHNDLRRQSDAGSRFTSVRCDGRLTEVSATPPIETVGARSSQCPRRDDQRLTQDRTRPRTARPGPWKTVEDLELASPGWVYRHNTQPLHGYPGDIPLADLEQTFYADQTDHTEVVEIKAREFAANPGSSELLVGPTNQKSW